MLSDRCLSVLSCLSVCNVGVLWPNGWMDQDETWHASRPRPWPQMAEPPQFLAHICCGQTAGWIKMPHGREVGLSPRDIGWGQVLLRLLSKTKDLAERLSPYLSPRWVNTFGLDKSLRLLSKPKVLTQHVLSCWFCSDSAMLTKI